jgi:hypothetical protein
MLIISIKRANSQHTRSLPIPGGYPRHVLTHLNRSGYGKSFGNSHPNVSVHFPPVSVVGSANIDFSGERAAVDLAYKELAAHLALLDGATRSVSVDYLLHNVLNAKAGKQCVSATRFLVQVLTTLKVERLSRIQEHASILPSRN